MASRRLSTFGLIAIAAFGAVALYAYEQAAPDCDAAPIQDRVAALLRDQFHMESVYLNDVRDLSDGWFGGLFAGRRECAAQVAEIRANHSLPDLSWRALRYRTARTDDTVTANINLDLGAGEPYVAPTPTLLQRVFGSSED